MNTQTALLIFLGLGLMISKTNYAYITNTEDQHTSSGYPVNTTTICGVKK